tara:strand:- start:264 stop:563 length:300 start_codon:yes stop_codon:yes gene_type:complete
VSKKSHNLDGFIEEAKENIANDRAIALKLLTDMMQGMQAMHDHKEMGLIASKYLETLQRSNEQLVKLSSLIQKNSIKSAGLSELDKNEIYDLIQNNPED